MRKIKKSFMRLRRLIRIPLLLVLIVSAVYFSSSQLLPSRLLSKTSSDTPHSLSPTTVSLPPPSPTPTLQPALPSSSPIPLTQDIVYTEKNTTYQIAGNTDSQLRDEMNSKRPTGSDGGYDARTNWHIRWSYAYDMRGGLCGTGPAIVNVDVEFVFPQWDQPADASEDLKNKWTNYISSLTTHENGHKNFAVEGGKQILEILNALPGYSTCGELDSIANQKGNEILESIRMKDREYDSATRHGETQGAKFP